MGYRAERGGASNTSASGDHLISALAAVPGRKLNGKVVWQTYCSRHQAVKHKRGDNVHVGRQIWKQQAEAAGVRESGRGLASMHSKQRLHGLSGNDVVCDD